MANVTVTTSNPSITVDTTNSIITVNQTESNVIVGEVSVVTIPTNLVTANGTFGTLNVGNASTTQYTFPTDSPTIDQGLRAHANGTLYWSADVGLVDSVNGQTGDVVLTTDNINEGSTNLYFTNARADARVNAVLPNTDSLTEGSTNLYFTNARANTVIGTNTTDNLTEGSTNLYYTQGRFDTAFNAKSTTDLSEGTNLYYTDARADARVNLQTGTNLDLSNQTTTDLAEGTNLYYTDARVDSRLSSGSITSNISTSGHIITNNLTPVAGNTITVAGNMEVSGNLNVVEKVDLLLQDNEIVMNYGNATARDAFIYIDRSGSSLSNTFIKWDETNDRFEIDPQGGATYLRDDVHTGNKLYVGNDNNPNSFTGLGYWSRTTDTLGAGMFTDEHGITMNRGRDAGNMGFGTYTSIDTNGRYLLWNNTAGRWTFTNDGSTYNNMFVDGDAISSSNVTVTNTLKVDTIDNNTGSNITMNANVIVGVNPTGNVVSNVYNSTAITTIASALNTGRAGDIIALSGHGSQVFTDGTYIEIEGIIDSGATEINDNSPYYTKWNIFENGYELYEDSGLLIPAHPATTSGYITSPAGTPVAKNVTGTTTTTVYGPANLYLSGNIDSGNITNSGIITTTNSKTTTLSQTAEARPINLTDKYKITSDNLQLSQTGLVGSAPNSQGGSVGEGVFKYGEIQWEGLEPTNYNQTILHSGNVIPEAHNIVFNATAGSPTITITGYGGFKDYSGNGNGAVNTNDISGFIQNNIRTGQVISQNLDVVGNRADVGFNEKPLYVVSSDHANSTVTLNDVADANFTGDPVSGIANNGYLTVTEGVYNGSTGIRVTVLDGEYIGGSNVDLGNFGIVSYNRKNHNVNFDLDDLTYSAGLQRQDFTMIGDNLFTGRTYWKMGKSTLAGDTYQDESTFRAPRGIVIGDKTEYGNRPFRDTFEVNGINIGWDGKSESLGFNSGNKNLPVTQIGVGAFTDFSAQNEFRNYKSLAGPRLMFSSFDGNTDTPIALQYPRAGTEMGRVMAWGRSQNLSTPSTYNPSAKLSFYAVDYQGTNKTTDFVLSKATSSTVRQHIATDSNYQTTTKSSNSLHLSGGQIYFSPIGENNTSAQNRAPLETYAVARTVQATNTGSALYAYNGHNALKNNDIELGLFRNGNSFNDVVINLDRGSVNQRGSTALTVAQNFYSLGTFGVQGDAVRPEGFAATNSIPVDFVNGDQVTLNGFSGSFGTAVNGNTYYAKIDFGLLITLFTDITLTTGLNTGVANNTNVDEDKTATITFINRGAKYTGGAHRLYSWFLPNDQDDLYMYKDGQTGTQLYRYDSANSAFKYGSIGVHADTFTGNLTGNVTGTVSDLSNQTGHIRGLVGAGTGISYDSGTGVISLSDTDLISGVTAGSGLTGGGDTGNVTLNIGAGNGITVNADNVAVDMSVFSTTDLSEGTNLYYTDARVNALLPNTDSLTEGSTNLYFTNARADARVNLQTGTNLDLSNKTTSDLSEGTNLYYTDARADARVNALLPNTDSLTEGSTNLYYTDARADARVNLQTGTNLDLSNKDTDALSEGSTNLYYTDARVDARLNSGSVASISAEDVTLKQFQETVINHGNQSGDISSTLDLANGSIFKLTATGALTINSIANVAAGSSGVIIIAQDGNGSRALTTGANIKWAGGLNTLSTTPAEIDIINFFYDGTIYYFALSKGYA